MSFNIFYSILSELSILLFLMYIILLSSLETVFILFVVFAVSLLGSLSEYLSAWIFGVTLDSYKKCGELKTIKMLIIQPTPFSDGHLPNTDTMYLEFVIVHF